MNNTEQWLAKLETESKALKQSFQVAATKLGLFTKTTSISTTANTLTVNLPGSGGSFTENDQERVVVTFNTTSGANTLANLEYTCSQAFLPLVRRVTYSGGARWILTNSPNVDGGGVWHTTTYNFTVHSVVNGTLSATEATS